MRTPEDRKYSGQVLVFDGLGAGLFPAPKLILYVGDPGALAV